MRAGLDHEIKPSTITMAPGLCDGFGLASRKLGRLAGLR
jgi:hypothetical protein